MKKILTIIIITLCLCACGAPISKDYTYTSDSKVEKLMQENDFVILDVRTLSEYQESHVKGALNIPYDTIDENLDISKDKLIFVYCKSGVRSNKAYTTLTALGYNAYDLGAFNSLDLEKE